MIFGLRSIAAVGAALAITVVSTAAFAYPADVIAKCRGDYKRLCPGYKLESDELDACMRSKHRSISSPCLNTLVDNGLAPAVARRK